MKEDLKKIKDLKKKWQEKIVDPRLKRYKLAQSPTTFYTPSDLEDFDFTEKVGFPGQYPFTAGNDPVPGWQAMAESQAIASNRFEWGGASSGGAGKYAGFGTPEDYRDYLLRMHKLGRKGGPNFAMDLPTQCGYDSDDDRAMGEVGRVGVAVDTLKDFEVIYEAYTGDIDIDKIASNFTANGAASIIIAMYAALAEKRGIPLEKLRGTPQNDILKEYVGRGTYIFPARPSLRLFRDLLVFSANRLPKMNITSIGGYHMREAGVSREQDLAFSMAIGTEYLKTGVEAGVDIDLFAPKFTFNAFGGSMEFYKEIAFQRAARRMWANILKNRFGAKNPRSMMIRQIMTAHIGCSSTTLQRPLNNLTRAVVGGMAGGMSGGIPFGAMPPWDEPLGLGHSLEAQQLGHDATRILMYEAKLGEVLDPWAGSFFMETLTNEIEKSALEELKKIDEMGGALAAIEKGYMQHAASQGAYKRQKMIENHEQFVVGVNCFAGPTEIDVRTERSVEAVYDLNLTATAEKRKKEGLAKLKAERDNILVEDSLNKLGAAAKNEQENLMPFLIDCVKTYATLQEMCDAMRKEFGTAEPTTI